MSYFKVKSDSAANLSAINPYLQAGELVFNGLDLRCGAGFYNALQPLGFYADNYTQIEFFGLQFAHILDVYEYSAGVTYRDYGFVVSTQASADVRVKARARFLRANVGAAGVQPEITDLQLLSAGLSFGVSVGVLVAYA